MHQDQKGKSEHAQPQGDHLPVRGNISVCKCMVVCKENQMAPGGQGGHTVNGRIVSNPYKWTCLIEKMLEPAVLSIKVETIKGCQRTLTEATEAQSMISLASEEQTASGTAQAHCGYL